MDIVGDLKKYATGRFAKIIFFFLCSDLYSISIVNVTRKGCNFGYVEGMQVPGKLISGEAKIPDIFIRKYYGNYMDPKK